MDSCLVRPVFGRWVIPVVLALSFLLPCGLGWAAKPAIKARLVEKSLMLDGHAVEGLAVIVGERGHILRSVDGGRSWQQAEVATRATLTGVFLHNAQMGWAVGHDQSILRTKDGGSSWQKVYSDIEAQSPLLDVWFADDLRGYAIGAYGYFLQTSDGGMSWEPRRIAEEDFHLNKIVPAGGTRLFIVGEAGTILRSDDEGESWTQLTSPYPGSFFGALALSDQTLLVFGLRGNLFRSDDGGDHWRELATGTEASLTDGLRLADGRIVIGGLAGTLLVSQDQGQSFEVHQEGDRKGFSSLVTSVDSMLVGVGEFGVKQLPFHSFMMVK